jgi:hypothetical protein
MSPHKKRITLEIEVDVRRKGFVYATIVGYTGDAVGAGRGQQDAVESLIKDMIRVEDEYYSPEMSVEPDLAKFIYNKLKEQGFDNE